MSNKFSYRTKKYQSPPGCRKGLGPLTPGDDGRPPIGTAALQISEPPNPTLMIASGYVPMTPRGGSGPDEGTRPSISGNGRLAVTFEWLELGHAANIEIAWIPDNGPASVWTETRQARKISGAWLFNFTAMENAYQRNVTATITIPITPGQEV